MATDTPVYYADLPIFRHGHYYVRVLADSLSPDDVRLTTIEARYPRFIHAEVLRHRVDSHSVESSRARPLEDRTQPDGSVVKGTLTHVREDPFVPETFHQRVPGMGVGELMVKKDAIMCDTEWRAAAEDSAKHADFLNSVGLDKSRANRLLEPFMWVKDIITATEWRNMLALRCPPGDKPDPDFPAQLEFQQFMLLTRQALRMSKPAHLLHGWWHLPGATTHELAKLCEIRNNEYGAIDLDRYTNKLKTACSRRLARISFDKHDQPEPIDLSINKFGELVSKGHFSPTEHVARPMHGNDMFDGSPLQDKIMIPASEVSRALHAVMGENFQEEDQRDFCSAVHIPSCWAGNFRGWIQMRKEIPDEQDHSLLLDYEVL